MKTSRATFAFVLLATAPAFAADAAKKANAHAMSANAAEIKTPYPSGVVGLHYTRQRI